MPETTTLEALLNILCENVSKGQQNAQQTLYSLADAKDAKLAYDVLVACGLDAKYFADANGSDGKLYVQNASLAAATPAIHNMLSAASLLRQIKKLLDAQPTPAHYSLNFANTPSGSQLTLSLPANKHAAAPASPPKASPPLHGEKPPSNALPKQATARPDSLAGGPAVARAAIPKSFRTNETGEDSLLKRAFFYLTSHAFTSIAWTMFFMLILGIIFSIIITFRGFLCPDVATDARQIPSYCPQKSTQKQL